MLSLTNFWLAPFALFQVRQVRKIALRMDVPPGPLQGHVGTGPALRLLMLGDSSAVGVGAYSQATGFGEQLATRLGPTFSVDWTLAARSGDTTRGVLEQLRGLAAKPIDCVVVSVGVNDAKDQLSLNEWLANLNQIVELADQKFENPKIVFCGFPPVRHFPLLPWALRTILADRAELFDRKMEEITKSRENCFFVPVPLEELTIDDMATDGFHPGPNVYRAWTQDLANNIVRIFGASRT